MWLTCFIISVSCILFAVIILLFVNSGKYSKKRKISFFNYLFAGVFLAAFFIFIPTHGVTADNYVWGGLHTFLLSLFNSMQVFAIGCDFDVIKNNIYLCPAGLAGVYQAWSAALFVLAPIFTFGFVLSLFKNLSEYIKYLFAYNKEMYVFSELNEKSLALAGDIKIINKKVAIVFTDVFEENEEGTYELIENAQKIGAVCFKKDIMVIDFNKHSKKKSISFFTIGNNETENLNQTLKLIDNYRNRENTHIYVFSTKIESELLLTSVNKGLIKVRRINEVQSLVNRLLYEQGNILFDSAKETRDGRRKISAIVVGMGNHGTEMVKALSWFGQMDGYKLEINAFDKDSLAKEKFVAVAPELMSCSYNGVEIEGEAQYFIEIHPGINVETTVFSQAISKITDATYVFVALGNDDINIKTAVNLRMYFERMKIHPVVQAVVYNSQQKKALEGIENYQKQKYDIEFIGDIESSYSENVIVHSELEDEALKRHLKWGNEEEFWTFEYNYRSSMASAIHMKARIDCGIQCADKSEEELNEEERKVIESLEHRRWNAYMRAEGYVYSGSKEKSSRNDLAKMHNNLVDYSSLSKDDKLKDSRIGTN